MTNKEIIMAANELLTVCDGAIVQDGTGYNSCDAPFMKDILLLEDHTHNQVRIVYNILKKYSKQLLSHGIHYDDLKMDLSDIEKKYRHVKIDPSWNNYTINFGKHKGQSMGYIFKDDPTYIHWLSEESYIDDIKQVAKDVLAGKPMKLQPPKVDNIQLGYNEATKQILIRTPYSAKDKVKSLSMRSWDGDIKCWKSPVTIIEEVVELFKNDDVKISPELRYEFKRIKSLKSMSDRIESDLNLPNFGNGKTLMPFQKAGVEFVEKTNINALIADEMGLGKTAQSLASLQLHPELRPVLIVCPASLKLNWEREIQMWLETEDNIEILKGRKSKSLNASITIINYDIVTAWKDEILRYKPKIMICDESHMLKSQKAMRTKTIAELAKIIPHKILLTGTPVLNRPNELWQQLNIINPISFEKFTTYAFRYCNAQHNGFGWNFDGASNIDELANVLKSIMIRRTKGQVLTELPDKRRSLVPIEINNRKEYNKVEEHFRKWYFENHDKVTSMEELVQIEFLKQTAVKGKMKAAIDWIKNFIETGEKLVVFVTHHDVINQLMTHFGETAVKIDGTVSTETRQKNVDKFQNDPNVKIFVGNIQAAGIGITLTASSNVVFLELGWSPALHDQAEDRVHRIGQENRVNIYYLLGTNTIDERIISILESKRDIIDGVMSQKENLNFNLFKDLV